MNLSNFGKFEDTGVLVITDGAYQKLEEKTNSGMGYFFLVEQQSRSKNNFPSVEEQKYPPRTQIPLLLTRLLRMVSPLSGESGRSTLVRGGRPRSPWR